MLLPLRQRFPTPFDEVYWFPGGVDTYEKPKPLVLQNQLPNKNRFGGSYLQRAQTQSARDQTPYTQNSVTYIELSDEDLGLVPEVNSVGLITTTISETPPAGMVNIADELMESMEKDSVIYIELSDENMGLVPEADPVGLITTTVSETPPAGMVNIADELLESVEKDLVIHVVHLPDENLGLVSRTDPAETITIADELVVDEKQSEGSYLQRAQTQSARDQTPYTQNSITYIELSDEDLGLVPEANPVGLITTTVSETNPAETITITDELVVDENQSEGSYLYEDSGLVSTTNPVGMITIVPELAESVEKEVDPEDWKQVSTFIEDKRTEVTGHTYTKSPTNHKSKCHVKILEWDLEKSLRQILSMRLITGQLAIYRIVYDPGGGICSVKGIDHWWRGQGLKLAVHKIVYDPGGGGICIVEGWITGGGDKE
ncbi:hypothetical protein L211DRAFT_263815 [Terfezia boudieri ATCC MYA-4762]|uniref:Uncharacterized protein n=1 Tax=Terfezia boudieri ATCC MYA-4762 TaxID=1051890 RepID=A0A3N4M258_9PEZI|nr:hypothetical protein L211DRAFT_263815 [Terfezia boudieri ATCC MYA-4762]